MVITSKELHKNACMLGTILITNMNVTQANVYYILKSKLFNVGWGERGLKQYYKAEETA